MTRSAIIIAAALAVSSAALADDTVDRSWHLLTQTEGGAVTLLKDLTQHECEFSRDRAMGWPATDKEKQLARDNADRRRAAWEKWTLDHDCKGYGGQTSTTSYKQSDGTCVQGYEFGGIPVMSSPRPGHIKSAECFQ